MPAPVRWSLARPCLCCPSRVALSARLRLEEMLVRQLAAELRVRVRAALRPVLAAVELAAFQLQVNRRPDPVQSSNPAPKPVTRPQ